MKILHLVNNLALGGAERLISALAPLQAGAGNEVAVAALSGRGDFFGHQLESAGLRVLRLSEGSVYDPRLVPRLSALLGRERPDVLHVHLFPAQYFAALSALGGRRPRVLVSTEHSTDNRRAGKPLLRGLERFVYGRYDALAAVSAAVAGLFKAWLGEATRIVEIPNGVDLELFEPRAGLGEASFRDARRGLGLPEQGYLACMAGRLEPPKDPLLFLKALTKAPAGAFAVFAGEGSLRPSCEAAAEALGLAARVKFLGRRDDMPLLLRACDAFVLPSGYEGFGLSAVEAMASGLPCLLSDIPAFREVGGDAALYFKPGDAGALAAGLRSLIDKPELARALARAGLERAGKFDVRVTARRYLDLYAEISERKS